MTADVRNFQFIQYNRTERSTLQSRIKQICLKVTTSKYRWRFFIRTANREIKLEKNDRKKKKDKKKTLLYLDRRRSHINSQNSFTWKEETNFGSSGLELVIIFFNSYKKIIGLHHSFFLVIKLESIQKTVQVLNCFI